MKSTIFTFVLCVFSLCLADIVMAQGGRRDGTANSWLGLLRMESVQNELELVEDQQQEIEQLQEQMWEEMRERMAELRGQEMDPADRRARYAELREEMEERQMEYKDRIAEVLLPMQVKRLKELHIQSNSRRSGEGAVGVLQNDEIMKELGVTDSQRGKLEKKAQEVRKKLEEKMKKLRREAENEILSVLSESQRKQLREIIGDTFEFGNRNNRRFGRDQGRESRAGGGERGSR